MQCGPEEARPGPPHSPNVAGGASFPRPAPSPSPRGRLCLDSGRAYHQHPEEVQASDAGFHPQTPSRGQGRSPARLVRPNARPSPLLWEEFSRLYWSGARFLPEFTVWLTSLAALPPRKPRLIGSLAGLKVELRFYHLFHAQCSCGGEFLLLRPCLSCRGVGLEPSLLRCPPPGRGGERRFWRGPDLVSDLNSSLIRCVIWNKFCFSGPRFPHLVK